MGTQIKILPVLIVGFAIIMRLLPHPANVAPISALALFGGVYLPKKYAFILPLVALLISDYLIGFYGLEMFFVYGSFILTSLIGLWLKAHKNTIYIIGASLTSSVLFYIITNFGVWILPYSFYSKDINGLIQSYYFALPFFRNTILGDLFFAGVFFGGYELAFIIAKNYLPKKYLQKLGR